MNSGDERDKGLFWKLPVLKSNQIGKLGPAFGLGAGCGFGFGIGLVGGTGFGPGIPGLQLGFGFGAGCGIGLGFGYGLGKGVAYDENRRYSNVGRIYSARGNNGNGSVGDEIGAIVNEMVDNTRRLAEAASREVDKWRKL